MKSATNVRDRILGAALQLVDEQGVKALTQPRVAAAAGVRQSHLTYYFPRKADLFVALLQASHDQARKPRRSATKDTFNDALRALKGLMFDRQRMRFFLGIVLEASEEEDLQPALEEHARALAERVAAQFGRRGDDPAVIAFLDSLRGIGLRLLLQGKKGGAKEINLEKLAGTFGLVRPTAD